LKPDLPSSARTEELPLLTPSPTPHPSQDTFAARLGSFKPFSLSDTRFNRINKKSAEREQKIELAYQARSMEIKEEFKNRPPVRSLADILPINSKQLKRRQARRMADRAIITSRQKHVAAWNEMKLGSQMEFVER
jgi:hypothetical protein